MLRSLLSALRLECSGARRWLFIVLTAAWVLSMLVTPFRIDIFPALATLSVLLQTSVVLVALSCSWQIGRVVAALALVAGATLLIEAVGVETGLIFGDYHYSDALWPKIGHVPMLILAAWMMMLGPSWAVAETLLPDRVKQGIGGRAGFSAVAAGAITAWDLYLDPQMTMFGLWQWQWGGLYFGIPLQNFAGWWGTAFLVTFLLRPDGVPRTHLLLVYTITWLMQAVGLGVMFGRPWPALAGFIGMGLFAVPAWIAEWRSWTPSSGR